MKRCFLFIIFLNLTINAHSKSIIVPTEYQTIQSGIDAAVDGDSVLILQGEYAENVEVRDKSLSIIGVSGAQYTLIDGQQGIGIYCQATSSYVAGLSFNSCSWGMLIELLQGDSLIVENNIFERNSCGILISSFDGQGPLILGNWFRNNSPNGAIQNYDTTTRMYNNIFIENSSERGGAVFFVSAVIPSNPEVVNNTFFKNSASAQGGGIYIGWDCHAKIVNNIIVSNVNGGVCAGPEGYPELWYNDVWNNGGEDYIDCSRGAGDISDDPLFRSNSNFYLQPGSPCIDAGAPGERYSDPDHTRNDIGATGGPYATNLIMVTVAAADDSNPRIKHFTLGPNYPNPFNSSTIIQFMIPESGRVKADLYDIRGAHVLRLIDEVLNRGRHTIEITSTSLRTGVYAVSMQYGGQIEHMKITVLK
ncbi:right-handed parallel beta-helix repeat-containing protein [candidate division KSB1 bacterium]|nr:right-handed parallel beta-helix repeat-containing protein [candidate division KSB1 bacterium]